MPTINDIAKEAGVSHGTVSNVLNKTGKVSIEKIQLVENAIKKLGYVPNVQAQRLRQGSPNTIAVILPSLKEAKYIDFFTALQLNFPKSQKSLLVYQTEDIPAEEEVILDNLRASGLAALIVISTLSKECLENTGLCTAPSYLWSAGPERCGRTNGSFPLTRRRLVPQ